MQDNILPNNLHFTTTVWGETFTDLFVKVALPNQLSQNNLPSFSYEGKLPNKYNIYTTSEDAETIVSSRAYAKLTEMIETSILIIDDVMEELHAGNIDKYDVITRCHSRAISEAARDKGGIVVLNPDALIPDGTLTNVQRILMDGKRAVICGAIRVVSENVVSSLLGNYYSEIDSTITIPPRELAKLVYDNIHPDSKALFWDSSAFFNEWPAYLYWDVEHEGILQRGIHLHPLMTIPTESEKSLSPSKGIAIDGSDYVIRVCPNYDEVYLAEDSDEVFLVDLMKSRPDDHPGERAGLIHVAAWVKEHASPYHQNFLKAKVRIHFGNLSSKWEEVEHSSDEVVDSIFTCIGLLEKIPGALEDISSFREKTRQLQKEIGRFQEEVEHLREEIGDLQDVRDKLTSERDELKSEAARVYIALGVEFYRDGQLENAEGAMLKALEHDPDLAVAHVNLAQLYWKRGSVQNAIWYMQKATELDLSNSRDVAVEFLKEVIRSAYYDVKILVHLTGFAVKLGNAEVCYMLLERIRKLDPLHPVIQPLQRTLDIISMEKENSPRILQELRT